MQFTAQRIGLRLALLLGAFNLSHAADQSRDLLAESFAHPPADCRPLTWMHWMNGNASKAGMTKDLEALAEAGVGGALIFSVARGIPEGPVLFNSDEYREIMAHGVKEADRLGLAIGMHNCDGWSSSGGPWVSVEDSMKRVVWSEVVVNGGAVDVVLPRPPAKLDFYRDIAVVAYPVPPAERTLSRDRPKLSASVRGLDLTPLTDGNLDSAATLKGGSGKEKKPWIQLAYAQPFPAQSVVIEHNSRHASAVLLASDDGETFTKVAELGKVRTTKDTWVSSKTFPPVAARFFRIDFGEALQIRHLELAADPRMPDWIGRNGMGDAKDSELSPLSDLKKDAFIPLDRVRVIAEKPGAGGTLATTLPAGTWRIMRFGYTTTGAINVTATRAGEGLECDKLSRGALDRHWAAYMGRLIQESGPLAGKSLLFSEIDSYEVGGQNWTEGFAETFQEACGYDLVPFLPLLAGKPLGDPATSTAVLRDFRGRVASLMVENYYRRFTELCHRHGMRSYVEPYGNGPFNELTVGGMADIPMGEFQPNGRSKVKSAVSAGHTYGKPVVSAESFTSRDTPNWNVHPYLLKHAGDLAWTEGINEFMFHRFAHQSNTHVVPGMTMMNVGSHIDGTQTWWRNAGKAWMRYIQRGSYLLRQGVPVADVLVFVGEGSPHEVPEQLDPPLPAGYQFDACDTEVLLRRVGVKDGRLVLPEGTSYRVLALRNAGQMSLQTLKRIQELAAAGALIVGPKPTAPIGYREALAQRAEFTALADDVWRMETVHPKWTWEQLFAEHAIEPDLLIDGEKAAFIHRAIGETDCYFFVNPSKRDGDRTVSFRIGDRLPERWDADTGKREFVTGFTQKEGRTEVTLPLPGNGSAFILFRKPTASTPQPQKAAAKLPEPIPVQGPWQVAFDTAWGGPEAIVFDPLVDWKDHADEGIQYYSGTAVYRKTVTVPADWLRAGNRVVLDLGRVAIAAEVSINGHAVGTLWKPPFAIDATAALKAGKNELEIRVTNTWANRLIGDERLERTDGYAASGKMVGWYTRNEPPPAGPRRTFTTYNFYEKERKLQPSGLLGPVALYQKAQAPLP